MMQSLDGFFTKNEPNPYFNEKAKELKHLHYPEMGLLTEYPVLKACVDRGLYSAAMESGFEFKENNKKFKNEVYTCYYRAKKVVELFQEDHDIFFHGRSLAGMVLSCFIKKIIQATHPEISFKGFVPLRYPNSKTEDTGKYMQESCPDNGPEGTSKLLSVQANLLGELNGDCVRYYFLKNLNDLEKFTLIRNTQDQWIDSICRPILEDSLAQDIPNRRDRIKTAIEKMHNLFKKVSEMRLFSAGEIIIICVPKKLIKETGGAPDPKSSSLLYCSLPNGIPYQTEKTLETLEKDQQTEKIMEEARLALEKISHEYEEQNKAEQTAISAIKSMQRKLFCKTNKLTLEQYEDGLDALIPIRDKANKRCEELKREKKELEAKPKPTTMSQYRLFIDKLTPKKGIQIIGIHSLEKASKNNLYKDEMKELLEELFYVAPVLPKTTEQSVREGGNS